MSNIQTGAERMPHDLSHLGFLAGQIGRLITISTTPVIAGDSFEMESPAITGRSEERFSRNAETEIYTLSLHDALPIFPSWLPCWSDWSSYYHFNYSGYRWRLLRDGVASDNRKIGRAVQQECRDRDLHSFPTRRSSDLPILASLLVRLVVLLPFQLLRLSLATPSRWSRQR